jgi:hypothetical protein
MRESEEIKLLREIEQNLRAAKMSLLTDLVPESCKCSQEKTRRVFRCPEAFLIDMLLTQLENKGESNV